MAISLKNLIEDAVDGSFTLIYPDGSTATKQFRQRSFGYGDDEPLITTDLPGVNDSPSKALDFVDGVTDSFIRGGAALAGIRAVRDTERITKFLLTPEGIAHAAKETALQLTNPKSIISPHNRQWSPANLLAQIPLSTAGVHIRRDGLPLREKNRHTYEEEIKFYINEGGGFSYTGETKNPLTLLDLWKKYSYFFDEGNDPSRNIGLNYIIGFQGQQESFLKEYWGGPGPAFGLGNTTISRTTNTNQLNETLQDKGQGELSYEVREKIRTRNKAIRDSYFLGDPGEVKVEIDDEGNYVVNTTTTFDKGIDQLNASEIIPRENLTELYGDTLGLKDFIDFRISLIDTSNPLNDNVLYFRAYLDDYNDNFSGKWNPINYNGRAEEFYIYNGFNREINFTFKIAALSKPELIPIYQKLNALVGSTAPEYVNRRMRGRYVRVNIGDLLHETPGFFRGINLTWQTSYPWEIDKTEGQLPHVLQVNCNFTPIHDFTPESRPDTPFILNKTLFPNYVPDYVR